MSQPLEDELRALLGTGNNIEAIKRYREVRRCGLREAKEAVEAFAQSGTLPADNWRVDPNLNDEVRRLLENGEFIAAVRTYRDGHRISLREAKGRVEALAEEYGIPTPSKTGCFGMVFFALVSGALFAATVSATF